MRPIDAEELEKKLQEVRKYYIENGMYGAEHILVYDFMRYVWEAPTINPVRHGKWKLSEYAGVDYYQCSLCGHSVSPTAYNYCPYCGALMDGKADK